MRLGQHGKLATRSSRREAAAADAAGRPGWEGEQEEALKS